MQEILILFKLKFIEYEDSWLCCNISRYKNLSYETEDYKKLLKSQIGEMTSAENHSTDSLTTAAAAKDKRVAALNYLFDEESTLSQRLEKSVSFAGSPEDTELSSYLRELILPRDEDPSMWWNFQHRKYGPSLARLAKKYLPIPSSITPSEWVFSTVGNIISAKRNCLSPENANILIFLYRKRDILEQIMSRD